MRVLVVEDDKALGMFLQKGLGLAGHEVDLVGDGEAVLQHAAVRRPDLMVLDLGLSRPDGTEVLARIGIGYKDVSVAAASGRVLHAYRISARDLADGTGRGDQHRQCVRQLSAQKKLIAAGSADRASAVVIETVRGTGYCLIARPIGDISSALPETVDAAAVA
jgi:CheY-like chemotaxis protein